MKKFSILSSDIKKEELEEPSEKITSGVELESIIDIFKIENSDGVQENLIGLNTDLGTKPIKRGDEVYITAFIRKEGISMTSPATQCVLKLRVVDIYEGLTQLSRLIK